MENSASYIFLEEMFVHRQIQMVFHEFAKFVDFLKQEGLITMEEHQALLDLATTLNIDEHG